MKADSFWDGGRLQAVLLPEPVPAAHEIPQGSEAELASGKWTPAAVLFPLVPREAGYQVLLTQRTAHLRDHPGQISFPGGRTEASDASPWHTALREAREEIGLDPGHVRLLGYLPEYLTGTGFRVTPVVAEILPPFDLSPDTFEVADIFEVPLQFLLDESNYRQHQIEFNGEMRRFHAVPYGDRFIWGATAGMIRALVERMHAAAGV